MGDQMKEQDTNNMFESHFDLSNKNSPDLSAGLYFQIICHKIDMPEEHMIAVLVLINRVSNMA